MDIPHNIQKRIGDDETKQDNGLLSKCSTSILEIKPTTDRKAAVWSEPDAVLEAWLTKHELLDVLIALKYKRKHCGPAHTDWSLKQWCYRTQKRVWREFLLSRCHLFTYGV